MLIKGISNGKANKKNISSVVRLRKPYQYYFVNTLLENFYEVLKYMSEVFICRGGSGSGGGWGGKTEFVTQIIETNQDFVMPTDIVNNEVSVRIFGGGGGGTYDDYYRRGGGGGWMNNDILKLVPGVTYSITIGAGGGGSGGYSGGGTSFADKLYAAGGGAADGGSGGCGYASWQRNISGGRGYQFGGGWGSDGGSGGVWGGGGSATPGNSSKAYWTAKGGDGGYYGGAGATICSQYEAGSCIGSNGGYYGGGGGLMVNYRNTAGVGRGGWYNDNGTWKQSGFGGNGYNPNGNIKAEDGVNTIGFTNLFKTDRDENLAGNGKAATDGFGGGGGFGGCGSIYGGGGGYGGHGGYGGGGYGGNGNNTGFGKGGGGGYGKGADAGTDGGGAGYYDTSHGGGGGIKVNGKSYGYGGYGNNSGANGVCVLSYYRYLKE